MRLGLCLFLALSALAADWDQIPFPAWSDQTTLRLLTDSPWARRRTIKFEWHKRDLTRLDVNEIPGTRGPGINASPTMTGGSPVGGIGVPRSSLPPQADLLIRWSSALPIRHATALYKARAKSLDPSAVNALIPPPQADYVLEIYGLPAEVAHLGTSTLEVVAARSVTLTTSSGRTLKPSRAVARLDGLSLNIFLHFPRSAPLSLADRDIECAADFEIFRFKERFRLKEMTYLGHLDL